MEVKKRITVLVGGVGGAKLALGLAQIVEPGYLTVIVNTGDDFWHYGLRVCPDLDTVMYTLAGVVDSVNGWGVANDSTITLDTLQKFYDETPWFRLGDKDLATHLLRTHMLSEGHTLTSVTAHLACALHIPHTLLPMTDSPVATMLDTIEQGELAFQTYFVRYRWQPVVRSVRFDGIEKATLTPEVRTALDEADVVLFGPSNPWLSIAPILSIPGLRDVLASCDIPRVAITPIVGGQALKGPAAKLMMELGYADVSAGEVAAYYGDVINGFVYDVQDDSDIVIENLRAISLNTIMKTDEDKRSLAKQVLNWIEGW